MFAPSPIPPCRLACLHPLQYLLDEFGASCFSRLEQYAFGHLGGQPEAPCRVAWPFSNTSMQTCLPHLQYLLDAFGACCFSRLEQYAFGQLGGQPEPPCRLACPLSNTSLMTLVHAALPGLSNMHLASWEGNPLSLQRWRPAFARNLQQQQQSLMVRWPVSLRFLMWWPDLSSPLSTWRSWVP